MHGFALLQDSIFRHMYASAETLLRSSVLVQAQNISRRTDEHSAVTTLSRMFFETMHAAITAYVQLFIDAAQGVETEFGLYSEKISRGKFILPDVVMKLLIKWVKSQVEGFIVKLSQQVIDFILLPTGVSNKVDNFRSKRAIFPSAPLLR